MGNLSLSLSETRFEDRLLVKKNLRINLTDDDEHDEKFIQEKGGSKGSCTKRAMNVLRVSFVTILVN